MQANGTQEFAGITEVCEYITNKTKEKSDNKIYKYEISIYFSDGDKIEMQFKEKNNAIMFLRQLEA